MRTPPKNADKNKRKVYIIVRQQYAYLADLLANAFEGHDVEIIIDRRRGERRTRRVPVSPDRRARERRRSGEQLMEIVVGTVTGRVSSS